jgi:hypothetical protein
MSYFQNFTRPETWLPKKEKSNVNKNVSLKENLKKKSLNSPYQTTYLWPSCLKKESKR